MDAGELEYPPHAGRERLPARLSSLRGKLRAGLAWAARNLWSLLAILVAAGVLVGLHLESYDIEQQQAKAQRYKAFIDGLEKEGLARLQSGKSLTPIFRKHRENASLGDQYADFRTYIEELERTGAPAYSGASSTPGYLQSVRNAIDQSLDSGSKYHFVYRITQFLAGIALVAGLGGILAGSHVDGFQKLADMFRSSSGAPALLVPSLVITSVAVSSVQVAGSAPPPIVIERPVTAPPASPDLAAIAEISEVLRTTAISMETLAFYQVLHYTAPKTPVGTPDPMLAAIDGKIEAMRGAMARHADVEGVRDEVAVLGDEMKVTIANGLSPVTDGITGIRMQMVARTAFDETMAGIAERIGTGNETSAAIAAGLAVQRWANLTGESPGTFQASRSLGPKDVDALNRKMDDFERAQRQDGWLYKTMHEVRPLVESGARSCLRERFAVPREKPWLASIARKDECIPTSRIASN